VASAVGGLLRSFSAIVDGAGDDAYLAGTRPYSVAGALFGVSALVDLSGNDVYRGDDGSIGAGCFGVGYLHDGGGRDLFEGRNLCEGAGAFGIGILRSAASPEAPPGQELQPDRGYDAGLLPVPGTGAIPVRADDNDTYLAARYAQGCASTFGLGLLVDDAGSDVYRAGGLYLHIPLLPNDFQSLSQGFSIGFRPRAAGGVGILLDEQGNDFYDAEVFAQGTSYWYSLGLLFDGGGNDRYLATQYAQGAGVHLSIGSLWDRGGDDHYVSKFGVTQGMAHDLSVALFREESGNDYYAVSDGQGIAITNSVALFVDEQGDDFYATLNGGQGSANYRRGFSGAGIFLDLEGSDRYPEDARGRDGTLWAGSDFAIGIDLDRDIEIPGEVVPEIVLTAADSARAVEELFETASLWEVGSAREKVRRARQALIAKGIEAVDYAAGLDPEAEYEDGEPLTTETDLVYRTVRELADAYPDSMAARILPRLRDPDEQVQKNVIRLLGELKRKEARAPLEAMLRDPKQDRHWNRILGALGDIGEPDSRPAVRPFLKSPQERRRIIALDALRSLRDTTAVPLMMPLLDDEIFTVRSAAMASIGSFKTAAVERVITRLEALRSAPARTGVSARPADRADGSGKPRRESRGSSAGAAPTSSRIALVRILGNIAGALKDADDPVSLRARAQVRDALLEELAPHPSDVPEDRAQAGARAAAVTGLYRLGGPEMRDRVRNRMLDEYDPLVKRTYAWEEARATKQEAANQD
ncbi:MAG: HEAT repeat domain-containing protein, partial [Candidatus Eisenbacteria bacterium]|nr:HEAT repeat domain-containing protein [Candidatus Eisenbacteria bacterium]